MMTAPAAARVGASTMSEPIQPLEFTPQPGGRVHFLLPSAERADFRLFLQTKHQVRIDLVFAKRLPGRDEMMLRLPAGSPDSMKTLTGRIQELYQQWRESRKPD
jgi:hypothetical protein